MTGVLTLQMDPESQARFEASRQQYFPPERNQIAAHLTLFHTLPVTGVVAEELEEAAGGRTRFAMQVSGLRSLGKGVAYRLQSKELLALHERLSQAFAGEISAQDQQRFQPHVVVQNKVTAEAARALLAQLEREFAPWTVEALGLELWHYLGGPWELARRFPFASAMQ